MAAIPALTGGVNNSHPPPIAADQRPRPTTHLGPKMSNSRNFTVPGALEHSGIIPTRASARKLETLDRARRPGLANSPPPAHQKGALSRLLWGWRRRGR